MKSLIKPVGLVVVSGLLILFGVKLLFTQEASQIRPTRPHRPQDTTKTPEPVRKETYVSKVILQAPWGEKNLVYDKEESKSGEFGVHEEFQEPGATEGLITGPNAFTVAYNGDIYIADPLNKRIQKFSPEGEFLSAIPCTQMEHLCVDAQGYVYTGRFNHTAYPVVYKYDQAGNLLATYYLGLKQETGPETRPKYVWDGSGELYCDRKGRLFITYQKFYDRPLFPGDTLPSTAGFLMQIGTSSTPFTLEEKKRTIKVGGFVGTNTCTLEKDQFFLKVGRKYHLLNFSDDTIRTFNIPQSGGLVGFDEDFNMYTYDYDLEKRINVVRKYNSQGILISTIQYYPKHFVSPGVDCEGHLYVFTWFRDKGVEVTKWYKQ